MAESEEETCNARSCSHLPRRRPLGGVPTATGSAGHNIVFYFRDYTGSIVEYSAEEEIILNDATYAPRVWPTSDPRAADGLRPRSRFVEVTSHTF